MVFSGWFPGADANLLPVPCFAGDVAGEVGFGGAAPGFGSVGGGCPPGDDLTGRAGKRDDGTDPGGLQGFSSDDDGVFADLFGACTEPVSWPTVGRHGSAGPRSPRHGGGFRPPGAGASPEQLRHVDEGATPCPAATGPTTAGYRPATVIPSIRRVGALTAPLNTRSSAASSPGSMSWSRPAIVTSLTGSASAPSRMA